MISKICSLIIFCLTLTTSIHAQEAIAPRTSPIALATARYKDTYLKITYGQPQKKGRQIFGALVPYGQVWQTGANENTELTTTRDLEINGTLLKAGTYSLFTIPEKDHWTVIINSDVGQVGAYTYNTKLDVLRFNVPAQAVTGDVVYEPLTIILDQKNEKADLILAWDKTRVVIPIQFTEPKTP